MKPETREWIAKADGDFYDAQRGVRARKHANYDGVCFHAQQCIADYAVAFRYPAESATKQQAGRAFAICKRLRLQIRDALGLREPSSRAKRRPVAHRHATTRPHR